MLTRLLPAWLVALCVLAVEPSLLAQQRAADRSTAVSSGWDAMKARRYGDAYDTFTAATRVHPARAEFWTGAGMAAFMLGRHDEAEPWLERALELDARETEASEVLGQIQHDAGRIGDAIATYEAALEHAPANRLLKSRLAQWHKEHAVEDRFLESRGAHFRVRFEGPADEPVARRAVEVLESAYWRVGNALTAYPPRTVNVVLYTEQQFQDVTRSPAWSAGIFDGQIRLPVRGALAQSADLERVLVHEYVHAVVATIGGRRVPAWLNEGLAMVYQPGGVEEAEETLAHLASRPRLTQLERSFTGLPGSSVAVAYAHSAVAVRRMIDLRGAPAVVALLQDLARGTALAPSFHQHIAMPYDDFDRMVGR